MLSKPKKMSNELIEGLVNLVCGICGISVFFLSYTLHCIYHEYIHLIVLRAFGIDGELTVYLPFYEDKYPVMKVSYTGSKLKDWQRIIVQMSPFVIINIWALSIIFLSYKYSQNLNIFFFCLGYGISCLQDNWQGSASDIRTTKDIIFKTKNS